MTPCRRTLQGDSSARLSSLHCAAILGARLAGRQQMSTQVSAASLRACMPSLHMEAGAAAGGGGGGGDRGNLEVDVDLLVVIDLRRPPQHVIFRAAPTSGRARPCHAAIRRVM